MFETLKALTSQECVASSRVSSHHSGHCAKEGQELQGPKAATLPQWLRLEGVHVFIRPKLSNLCMIDLNENMQVRWKSCSPYSLGG